MNRAFSSGFPTPADILAEDERILLDLTLQAWSWPPTGRRQRAVERHVAAMISRHGDETLTICNRVREKAEAMVKAQAIVTRDKP